MSRRRRAARSGKGARASQERAAARESDGQIGPRIRDDLRTGIGDALLTYENELILRKLQGREIPFVVPDATMLIENPAAVVDKNADKHGVRELAEEFVAFLRTTRPSARSPATGSAR